MNHEEASIAESASETTYAVVEGEVVGEVDGLVWEDATGVDVISITTEDSRIVVPVEHDEWRQAGELAIERNVLDDAPKLHELQAAGGRGAIALVADTYTMDLAGPPPGPNTGPLPPWWRKAGS